MPAQSAPRTSNLDPDAIQADAINQTVSSAVPPLQNEDAATKVYLAQNASPASQPKQPNRRFFGIPKRNANAFPNADDYEMKYPEDAYGEEMGATARVWRTYLDEAHKADTELVEGWRDTTDVLLVFTGLFSAVVATFVVQTSTSLQADYSQITASLLVEQNALLRATANHTSLNNIPPSALSPDSDFPIANHDRWVNGLWFTSLSVSPVAAFMAVLVKQWIQHYVSVVSGTPHDQVRIRQFRFLGVERWQMPLIISTLPMLLHLALLLYFAGLVLFLWPLDAPIAYTTLVIAILAYGFYSVSNVLPLWYPICPYKTPLSSLLAASPSSLRLLSSTLLFKLRSSYRIFIQWLRKTFHAKPLDDTFYGRGEENEDHSAGRRALYHMKEAEKRAASKRGDEIDAEALVWLYSTSSNPTVASVTVQAISGLRLGLLKPARKILKKVITLKPNSAEYVLLRNLDHRDQHGRREDDTPQAERLLRSCHQLGAMLDYALWENTRNMIANTNDPALQVLHACHSMLAYRIFSRKEPETPIAALESCKHKEKCTPFMWSVLLKRCQSENFDDPAKHWLHGIRVLHNLPKSFDSENSLRYSMLLEYLCSCSGYNAGSWGEFSVLEESPFRVEKVLPQIYSALSEALRVLSWPLLSSETEMTSNNSVPHATLPPVLRHILGFTTRILEHNVDLVDQEAITKAASALQLEMQKLVASDSFWKNEESSKQRSDLCSLLTQSVFWPRWIPPSTISWTPELMDFFLRSCHWGYSWAKSSFFEGNPDVYQLFEGRDGLSKVNDGMHRIGFCECYLQGLTCWKGDPDDREQHIQYLFAPENFVRVVEEFIVKKQEDGTYKVVNERWSPYFVGRLFRIRSPDLENYGEYLEPFLKLIEDRSWLLHQPESVAAEPEASDSENKLRWKRFFSTGERRLLHWIRYRGKTGGQIDPERGAEAA